MKEKDYLIYYLETAVTNHTGFAVIPPQIGELIKNYICNGSFDYEYEINEHASDQATMRFDYADAKNPLTLDVNYSGIAELAIEATFSLLRDALECGDISKEDLENVFNESSVLVQMITKEGYEVQNFVSDWVAELEDGYYGCEITETILYLYYRNIYKHPLNMDKKISIVLDDESLEIIKGMIGVGVLKGKITKTIM